MEDALASAPAVFLGFRLALPAPGFPDPDASRFRPDEGAGAPGSTAAFSTGRRKSPFSYPAESSTATTAPCYKIFIIASQPQISACRDAVFAELDKAQAMLFSARPNSPRPKRSTARIILNRTATTMDRAIFLIRVVLDLSGRRPDAGRSARGDRTGPESHAQPISSAIVNRYFAVENCVVLQVRMK